MPSFYNRLVSLMMKYNVMIIIREPSKPEIECKMLPGELQRCIIVDVIMFLKF